MDEFISVLLRIFQIVFAVLVLALSVSAVRWQYYHSVPKTNAFVTFAAIFGCLTALIGFASTWIDPLAGIFMSILDWLATIFFLAGGIAMAVGLRGVNCGNGDVWTTWLNYLISGGCIFDWVGNQYQCGFYSTADIERRCHMAEANTAFLFLSFLVSLGAAIFCVRVARSKKKASSAATTA